MILDICLTFGIIICEKKELDHTSLEWNKWYVEGEKLDHTSLEWNKWYIERKKLDYTSW